MMRSFSLDADSLKNTGNGGGVIPQFVAILENVYRKNRTLGVRVLVMSPRQ